MCMYIKLLKVEPVDEIQVGFNQDLQFAVEKYLTLTLEKVAFSQIIHIYLNQDSFFPFHSLRTSNLPWCVEHYMIQK